jgi:hypothetical protein
VLVINLVKPSNECGVDNPGCALAGPDRLWLGRVFTSSGSPAAYANVQYSFTSELVPPVTVVSDREGRYCIRWPAESEPAGVAVTTRAAGGPPDSEYVALAEQANGPLIVSPNNAELPEAGGGDYGTVTSVGWNAETDATKRCVSSSPPWYRIESLSSNWRSVLLYIGPAIAWLMAFVGGVRWLANKSRGPRILAYSFVLMAASAAFCALVWLQLPTPG